MFHLHVGLIFILPGSKFDFILRICTSLYYSQTTRSFSQNIIMAGHIVERKEIMQLLIAIIQYVAEYEIKV